MFKALQNSILSLICPRECRVCSCQVECLDDGVACSECWAATHIFHGSEMLCDKCGAFYGNEAAPVRVFCHKCDDHYYEKASAIGIYENALATSIISLKSTPVLAKTIRSIIAKMVERTNFSGIDLLIPIPLSKKRRLERGFNQAEIIADEIGRQIHVPVDPHSLSRKLHSPIHRVGMDQKARELTVKNSFEVVRPKLIAGKSILLVDDVFTSGSTASNCAKILKKNGAASVNVITLARAVLR